MIDRSVISSLLANPVNSATISLVDPLVPIHQIHFVHTQDQMRHPQQRAQEGVPARLLDDSLASIDQDQGQVGRGGAGDHVPGVLDVPWRVRDDEFSPRGGEVSVGDIDGDALLAFGAQPIGQQREVGVLVASGRADRFHRRQLVGEQRLRVIEQAADQRGLAVVHAPGCGKAEEFDAHQK